MKTVIELKNLNKSFRVQKKIISGGDSEIVGGSLWKILKPKVNKEWHEMRAVADVNFSVQEGEMLAFMGPNGAGKSTTIKMLSGILYPTSGEGSVLGLTPWKDRQKLAYQIGTVFGQKSQLWMHLPPLDTFDLLSYIYEMDRGEYRKRRDYLIEVFDLKDLLSLPVRKLSLGQRMRCEMAASLLHRPRIIFLDEPTIGLDPVVKASIRRFIKRANEEEKVTVFLTSHDTGDIEELCKRSIIINQGRLIYDGKVSQLRRQFLNKKILTLKIDGDFASDFSLQGTMLMKMKGGGAKLVVNTAENSIENVLKEVMQKHRILDMTITDPPLEEVIADIYVHGYRGNEDHE